MKTKVKTQDDLVKELFDKVQARKLEVEKAERPQWVTGGLFGYNAHSAHDRTDIKTITDQRKLVDILAFLKERSKSTMEAAESLGASYEFKWLGFTLEEWVSDIKLRFDQITLQTKRKELNDLEARLNTLISPELKAKMELEAIQAALA